MESKRQKLENEEISSKKTLPDELVTRMENNRYEAKLKLTSKQTFGLITNFGVSWYKILEPEFSKPYFLKANFILNFFLKSFYI